MALSNTATPKYYAQFKEKVIRGEIPVCREISMEMNRIDALVANPSIWYDDLAVEGFIAFCEAELTLTDGADLHLLDTFKLWAEEIFGWYYFEEKYVPQPLPSGKVKWVRKTVRKRLINKQFLIVPRGAAKSMYASLIQMHFLIVDTTTTHQVTTAPTMKLAEEVLSPMRTAITRSRGPVFKFLTAGDIHSTSGSRLGRVKLASTKKGIENFTNGSFLEIRAMSINKLQGLRVKCTTIDEWLSGDTKEDVIGAVEQGASKVDDWLILATSSEGTVRNGAGDAIKMELYKILRGEYINPHVSIWFYKLDSINEIAFPELWIKANPNLGHTVEYSTYVREVERAEKAPAARNDILAKRFNIPLEGYTYFFSYEETLRHPRQFCDRMLCSMGVDLSQGDDFCSFSFLFPLSNGSYVIKTRNYITSKTYETLHVALQSKYMEFIAEGSLIVMEGVTLNVPEVYQDLDNFISQHGYEVQCMGYDPYNIKEFLDLWISDNGEYGNEIVPQGARTESVPLGELKKLSENRMLLFDELLVSWTMGNCITVEDNNGNRKLLKRRREEKIDAVAATMDAYIAYKHHKDMFM